MHKYAYVHGDPIQLVDPTGEFGTGAKIAVAVSIAVAIGVAVGAHYFQSEYEENNDPLATIGFSNPIGATEGKWSTNRYVSQIKPHFTNEDFTCARSGCVGIVRIRLGLGVSTSTQNEPHKEIPGTRGFTNLPDAMLAATAMESAGLKPWIYAIQLTDFPPPTFVSPDEVDVMTLSTREGSFNFASLLIFDDGSLSWEDMAGGISSGDGKVKRTPFDFSKSHYGLAPSYTGRKPFTEFFMVSPTYDSATIY